VAITGADTVIEATVGPGVAGRRLDAARAEAVADLSRARAQALIRAGRVRLNGAPALELAQRVAAGDRLTVSVPAPVAATPLPEPIPLAVVYEDDALIVIDKPAGLVVHPAAGHAAGTLVNALLHHCGASLSGIGGVARPGIVHRLDKDTSGLMVVAKTDTAHRGLAEQFADHGRAGPLRRGYQAIVWGVPSPRRGTVDAPIGRAPNHRQRFAVRPDGKRAVTHYEMLETFGGERPLASLLGCRLETGRTHQIRVHMTHLGHPLLTDPVYGTGMRSKAARLGAAARAALGALDRQALHAVHLTFAHPVTGNIAAFDSPLPTDLASVLAALRQPVAVAESP
jgi:23S rRNA pseudouridine1911/1915/1917 synthase